MSGDSSEAPRLSLEDKRLLQSIGSRLRRIIRGEQVEAEFIDRRDELGVLANMVNRVARELYLSKQRDITQRQEIEDRLQELREAYATQEVLLARIQELSSPVLNIYDGVLLLPIIGALDSSRANHTIGVLLERVASSRAKVVILDVTGAYTIDSQVANALIAASKATHLLGAHVIICGIGPEVAQVLVSLGIELENITTRADLQEALATALSMTGRRISKA